LFCAIVVFPSQEAGKCKISVTFQVSLVCDYLILEWSWQKYIPSFFWCVWGELAQFVAWWQSFGNSIWLDCASCISLGFFLPFF